MTPQLQLHDLTTTTAAALHHTTSSSCGWGDHCNPCNHSKKHNFNPPFSPSVDSLCHPWITTTNLSFRFPILKLPPPPCALLVTYWFLIRFHVLWGWGAGYQLVAVGCCCDRCCACRTCDHRWLSWCRKPCPARSGVALQVAAWTILPHTLAAGRPEC